MTTGTRTPQLILTLSPQGLLQVELPGANGGRRKIELRDSEAVADLKRMLVAQLSAHYAFGEDGAPTEQQVKHWEQHGVWADSRCPFCRAEGRGESTSGSGRSRRGHEISNYGGVTITRIEPKASGRKDQKARKSAEELGL